MREGFWEGAAGYGDFEGVVAVEASGLALDYVVSEGSCEGVDGGEGEEVGLSCHDGREGVKEVGGYDEGSLIKIVSLSIEEE